MRPIQARARGICGKNPLLRHVAIRVKLIFLRKDSIYNGDLTGSWLADQIRHTVRSCFVRRQQWKVTSHPSSVPEKNGFNFLRQRWLGVHMSGAFSYFVSSNYHSNDHR